MSIQYKLKAIACFAGALLLPLAVLWWFRADLLYAFDHGQATVSIRALPKAKLSSHHLKVTDAAVDGHHCVLWEILRDGSVEDQFHLCPVYAKGATKGDTVNLVVSSRSPIASSVGVVSGLLHNEAGEGTSAALREKLRQEGVRVADAAMMMDLDDDGSAPNPNLLVVSILTLLAFAMPLFFGWLTLQEGRTSAPPA